MCGNYKVFDGMIIELLSLVKHNKHQFTLYLMTMDLVEYDKNFVSVDEKMCNYLEEILKTGNKDSKIVRLDMRDAFINEMKDSPNMKTFYTPYTMLRLFADYLPINLEKILYLDCDLGFLGDISPLYNLDLTGYEYGAAYDVLGRYFIGNYYQNAGVILFNLNECRKSKLFENCRYLCLHEKMAFLDQDALNRTVKNKYYIPYIYNVQRNMKKGTVIKHFCKTIRWIPFYHTSNIKPWNVEGVHKVLKINVFDDILEEYQKRIKEYKK
jgi:Lipopolysaccharide biosynthesis proteins, LPS:glycosyltransferases